MPIKIIYEKTENPIKEIVHTDTYGDRLRAYRVGNSLFISQAHDSTGESISQEFTPKEAREFAQAFIKLADQIDKE